MTFNKQYTYYCLVFALCMGCILSVESSLSSAVSSSLPCFKDLQLPSTSSRLYTQPQDRQSRTSSDINRAMYSNYLGDLAFINHSQTFSHLPVSKSAQDMHKFQYFTSTPTSINTRLYMSTPPKRRTQQTTSRNRGANAANHNRRGHTFRLEGGNKKVHRKGSNTKRAPRWEREGDKLYAEVTKQLLDSDEDGSSGNKVLLSLADKKIESVQDVCDMLAPWMATDEELLKRANTKKKITPPKSKEEEDETTEQSTSNKSPPFLWGSLPVGPVLASRLLASNRPSPTSVQRSAFSILTAGLSKGNKKNTSTKRTNAIIASPTGTGKTLAYLLPLLCTSPGGQSGEGTGGVLIVTPTIELACQIQREVDVLWPPSEEGDGDSSCFVVGAVDDLTDNVEEKEDDGFISPGRVILQSIKHSPLIAGTPKMLRMLYKEAGRIVHEYNDDDYTITREERTTAQELLTNLRAIVLDEADRLLRTEAVARETTERKQRKIAQRNEAHDTAASRVKKKRLVVARQTQTEFLLRDLPIPSLDDVQIICASATIGRTMRRQLMQILDKPSADAAATLVTGDEDERVKSKDAERRKSVLLPERLRHAYRVVKEAGLSPSTRDQPLLDNMIKAERNDELRARDTMSTLWDIMTSIEDAKPIIIFPGRVGVERVQRELIARGLDDVRTLRNLDGKSPEADMEVKELGTSVSIDHKWKSIPVYIIGERFARGLDLPDVEYVFMLSPPSSAAGYAHMAGRTGRVGREGTAITLVRPKNNEVQRLAAIAEALGLKFAESMCGGAEGEADADQNLLIQDEIEDTTHVQIKNDIDLKETINYPWASLSESQLRKKLNSELSDYLVSHGAPIGRRPKKADLLAAIQTLHSKV